jgi:hypothetical protein
MDPASMTVPVADIVKIAAAAILGFLANVILEYFKASRQPKRRIVYDANTISAFEQVESNIAQDIDIYFKGQIARSIQYHRIYFNNIGNSQINNQDLRIQVPDNSNILKLYFDPEPEYEMGVQDLGFNESKKSWIFKVSLFRPGERIIAHMIIDSDSTEKLNIFSKNEEEYVELVPGRVEALQDERSSLSTFFFLVALWFLIPPITGIAVLGELISYVNFQPIAEGFVRLILLALIIPRLTFACRQIAGIFIDMKNKDERDVNKLHIHDNDYPVMVASGRHNTLNLGKIFPKEKSTEANGSDK